MAKIQNLSFYLLGAVGVDNPSAIPITQIQQWQNDKLVKYLGVSQNIKEILEQISVLVLPSYKEGLPMSVLEAMSMGKPIITTDVSGCRDCVKLNKCDFVDSIQIGTNGILCQSKNAKSLYLALKKFINLSVEQRANMGANGRQIAKEKFDIKYIIKHYQDAMSTHLARMSSKRLAFISNTSFGMWNFRKEVLRALINDKYEIYIIAPFDETTPKLESIGCKCVNIGLDSKGLNPFRDMALAYRLYKLLKNIKANIVFNYTIKPVIYGSLVARVLGISHISMVTGLGYVFIAGGLKKKILRFIVCNMYKIALKRAKSVWFLNDDDKAEFLAHKLIRPHQAYKLDGEGVDTQYFSPSLESNVPDNEIRFLLVARMLWDKGVGEYIEAIKMLKEDESLKDRVRFGGNYNL